MNASADLPIAPADGQTTPVADTFLWHHRAFCRVALPVRAPSKGTWQREAGGVVLTMEAGDGAALPTGKFVRLLLMFLFDTAVRTGHASIEIGDDAVTVARRIGSETSGAKLRELQEQMARLLAARITVAWDGRPALGVFDARGRSRSAAPAWRSSIRMNARFLAGLIDTAVALEQPVLKVLADSTLALDLYAWLASEPDHADGLAATVLGWEDLRARFGGASQPTAEFRTAFELALMQVQQVWPHFTSVMRDDAVEFRRAAAPSGPGKVAEHVADQVPGIALASLSEQEAEPAPPAPNAAPVAPQPDHAPSPVPAERVGSVEPLAAAVSRGEPVPVRTNNGPPRITRQTVSLKSHLTGLPQVVWLQRSNGRENVVIEVTPGGRYDPENCTVIALEPVALQVVGGLYTRDFERVAAWAAANRDLIDDWWDSQLDEFDEVASRVKKVPAPAWR